MCSHEPDAEQKELLKLVVALEAILFTCAEPVESNRLSEVLTPEAPERVLEALRLLDQRLQDENRGLQLKKNSGWMAAANQGALQ